MKKEDLEAIIKDENAIKLIAAKVLDIIKTIPKEEIVCEGYYSNTGDQISDKQQTHWSRSLKTHELTIDDEIIQKIIKDIPLSEEEITQTAVELKTGAKGDLTEEVVRAAVGKVLIDNVIMERKGSLSVGSLTCQIGGPSNLACTVCGPFDTNNVTHSYRCHFCGPNKASSFKPCLPCSPTASTAHSPCHACGPFLSKFHSLQCQPAFSGTGCIAAYDPIINDFTHGDIQEQVSNLQIQVQALQRKLAGK